MWSSLVLFFSSAWVWLKPIVLALLSEVTKELLEEALEIVKEVSTSEMSSNEKRIYAFNKIKELKDDLSDNTVNLVLEMVYKKFKSE